MVFIVVFLLLLSSGLYLFNKSRRDEDTPFWKGLVEAISMKVVDYYCKGTPTKIVAMFLRGIFSIYSMVALGYPTIKAFYKGSDAKSFFEILVTWDGVSTNLTILFVVVATVVVVVYLILHRYEAQTTKAIMETAERSIKIEALGERIMLQNDEILKRLVDDDFQKIKEKMNGISASEYQKEAVLREVYQLIQNEANHVTFCTERVLRHGGVEWWGRIDIKRELRKQIELLRMFVLKYQVYFSKTFFDEVMAHYELSVTLQNELDSLVMAIATADNQDGITDVYYITYEKKIDCTAEFVAYMMDEFQKVDKHPAYGEYARLYKEHEESSNRLITQIELKSGMVI